MAVRDEDQAGRGAGGAGFVGEHVQHFQETQMLSPLPRSLHVSSHYLLDSPLAPHHNCL